MVDGDEVAVEFYAKKICKTTGNHFQTLFQVVYGMGTAPSGQWIRMTRDIITDLDK